MPYSCSRGVRKSHSSGMGARHFAHRAASFTYLMFFLALWCASAFVSTASATPTGSATSTKGHILAKVYRANLETLQIKLHGKGATSERFLFRLPGDFDVTNSGVHITSTSAIGSRLARTHLATLSLFEEGAFLFFTSRRRDRPVVVQLAPPKGETSLPVRRANVHRGRPGQVGMCGRHNRIFTSDTSRPGKTSPTASPRRARGPYRNETPPSPKLREVEMEIFYDPSFATSVAGARSNYIASLIYATNQLYLRRMGIEVRVTRCIPLETSQDSLAPLSSEELLERFRSVVLSTTPRADLTHLFAGESLDLTTAGLAYTGSACVQRGRYAVGLSHSVSPTLQMIVFAHEIMHGLGAEHDNTLFSVMSPMLSASNRRLSPTARQSISDFLAESGRCISPLRPPFASLRVGFSTALFEAQISVDRPRTIPCEVLVQGRMLPGKKGQEHPLRNSPWRTIVQVALPLVRASDQATVSLVAPAPSLPAQLNHEAELRALVRCAQRLESSNVQRVSPPTIDVTTTTEAPTGDLIEQLTRSIRVQGE